MAKEKKEGAEDVLALGDPGNGFHVQRMEGEERGDEKTGADAASNPCEDKKQHGGVQSVDEDAYEMMTGRIQGEKLIVEGVGKPRDWVPIGGGGCGEGPSDGGPTQAAADVRVAGDIYTIVPKDEAVPQHGNVEDKG